MVVLEMMQKILETYSQGIKNSLKTGKSAIFITEDIFTVGKPIL
jgi:hypothetical protein